MDKKMTIFDSGTPQASIPIMSCVAREAAQKRSMWTWRRDSNPRPATPGPSGFSKAARIRKFSAPPELPPIKGAVPIGITRKRSQTLPCFVEGRQGLRVEEDYCGINAPFLRLDPKNPRPSTKHKNNLYLLQQTQYRPLSGVKKCSSMQNLTTVILDDGMSKSKRLAGHFEESSDREGFAGHSKLTEERLNSHKTKYAGSEDSMSDAKKDMILRWLCSTESKPVICTCESVDCTLPQL